MAELTFEQKLAALRKKQAERLVSIRSENDQRNLEELERLQNEAIEAEKRVLEHQKKNGGKLNI